MFNVGPWEVMVIALLALVVLGPTRLPEAARQIGSLMGEIRKLSSGFQREMKAAFDDETEKSARARGAAAVATPTTVDEPAAAPPTIGALPPTDDGPAPAAPAAPAPRKRAEPLRAPAKKAAAKKSAAKKAAAKRTST